MRRKNPCGIERELAAARIVAALSIALLFKWQDRVGIWV